MNRDDVLTARSSKELFGDTTDARAVKRAYAKLIREFKPEGDPEVFAHIRAIYERFTETRRWEEAASQERSSSPPMAQWLAAPESVAAALTPAEAALAGIEAAISNPADQSLASIDDRLAELSHLSLSAAHEQRLESGLLASRSLLQAAADEAVGEGFVGAVFAMMRPQQPDPLALSGVDDLAACVEQLRQYHPGAYCLLYHLRSRVERRISESKPALPSRSYRGFKVASRHVASMPINAPLIAGVVVSAGLTGGLTLALLFLFFVGLLLLDVYERLAFPSSKWSDRRPEVLELLREHTLFPTELQSAALREVAIPPPRYKGSEVDMAIPGDHVLIHVREDLALFFECLTPAHIARLGEVT